MQHFDFFLDERFCDKRVDHYVGSSHCTPNEETRQWFRDQGINLYVGHQTTIGVICTALNVTEDQALLVQLAFDIKADTSELYTPTRLTI